MIQGPVTFPRIMLTQEPLALPRDTTSSESFTFMWIRQPRLGFARGAANPQCCHGRHELGLTKSCSVTILQWPPFNSYDGKMNPMEHISHYIHMMSLHAHNDALMCKVFPFSLGSMVLRWFNGLRKGFIRNFIELI